MAADHIQATELLLTIATTTTNNSLNITSICVDSLYKCEQEHKKKTDLK